MNRDIVKRYNKVILSYLNIFYVLKKNIVDSAHNSGLWTGKWNRFTSNLCRLTEFKATVSSILEIMIALKGPREIYPYWTSVNAFSVVRGELIPPGIFVSARHKNGATAKCCRVFQSPWVSNSQKVSSRIFVCLWKSSYPIQSNSYASRSFFYQQNSQSAMLQKRKKEKKKKQNGRSSRNGLQICLWEVAC